MPSTPVHQAPAVAGDPIQATAQALSLGCVPYDQARRIQDLLAEALTAGLIPPTLLLLEHPPVFTLGSRGNRANLVWDEATLRARGVEVVETDRGGDITFHGPGQVVAYPILPLGRVDPQGRLPAVDYVAYLRRLERTIVQTLARFGIVSGQLPGLTGVWVQPHVASRCRHCPPAARRRPSKIASIGVKVDSHGVTRHGLALNVAPEMDYWEGIVACGLPDYPAISMAELLEAPPSMQAVMEALAFSFVEVFGFEDVRFFTYG